MALKRAEMQPQRNTKCKGCVLLVSEIPGHFNSLFTGINYGIWLLGCASATTCFCISGPAQRKINVSFAQGGCYPTTLNLFLGWRNIPGQAWIIFQTAQYDKIFQPEYRREPTEKYFCSCSSALTEILSTLQRVKQPPETIGKGSHHIYCLHKGRWEIRRQRGEQSQRRKWLHIHTNKRKFYYCVLQIVVEKLC